MIINVTTKFGVGEKVIPIVLCNVNEPALQYKVWQLLDVKQGNYVDSNGVIYFNIDSMILNIKKDKIKVDYRVGFWKFKEKDLFYSVEEAMAECQKRNRLSK